MLVNKAGEHSCCVCQFFLVNLVWGGGEGAVGAVFGKMLSRHLEFRVHDHVSSLWKFFFFFPNSINVLYIYYYLVIYFNKCSF